MMELLKTQLKTQRLKNGLTQEELGLLVEKESQAISNYEQGIRQPDLETLLRLCQVLDCTLLIRGDSVELKGNDTLPIAFTQEEYEAIIKETLKKLVNSNPNELLIFLDDFHVDFFGQERGSERGYVFLGPSRSLKSVLDESYRDSWSEELVKKIRQAFKEDCFDMIKTSLSLNGLEVTASVRYIYEDMEAVKTTQERIMEQHLNRWKNNSDTLMEDVMFDFVSDLAFESTSFIIKAFEVSA